MKELAILFAFLVPCVFFSWKLPEKFQLTSISTFTILFLAYQDCQSLFILVFSSSITYFLLKKTNSFKYSITITLILLVTLFVIFKWQYSFNQSSILQKAIPLGMSFYLFRLIHYTIEIYKGNLQEIEYQRFMGYMLFFPVLVIGPIIRLSDWNREVYRRRWDEELFSKGLERIVYGLFKIIVLGNYFFSFKIISYTDSLTNSWLNTYLEYISYVGNTYMQFAGYSDIAIGFSLLLGIRVKENFNYPFLAKNLSDFWNRWHISLSEWCKDYIFMPISSYSRMPWIAVIISMLVLGLWHEFSLRYILWAVFHGVGIILWDSILRFSPIKMPKRMNLISRIFSTFVCIHFVIFSFVWIKEDNIYQAINSLSLLIGLGS